MAFMFWRKLAFWPIGPTEAEDLICQLSKKVMFTGEREKIMWFSGLYEGHFQSQCNFWEMFFSMLFRKVHLGVEEEVQVLKMTFYLYLWMLLAVCVSCSCILVVTVGSWLSPFLKRKALVFSNRHPNTYWLYWFSQQTSNTAPNFKIPLHKNHD